MALTDDEQTELLNKVRAIHRETCESIEPNDAKGVKASGRWLLGASYNRLERLLKPKG